MITVLRKIPIDAIIFLIQRITLSDIDFI